MAKISGGRERRESCFGGKSEPDRNSRAADKPFSEIQHEQHATFRIRFLVELTQFNSAHIP
jgi:hypothetical protein